MLQLINDLLRPRLQRLDLPGHIPKLIPDHGLINQSLPKRLTLLRLGHHILHACPAPTKCLKHNPQSLVVEIHHCLPKPCAFGADKILGGHFDVFESHVSG